MSKLSSKNSLKGDVFYGAVTSFLFGLIVSLLFSIGTSLGLTPIEKFERSGVDFSVRIASAIHDLSSDTVSLPPDANPIVLIDIDRDSCIAVSSASRCDFDRIGQPEVIEAIKETLTSVSLDKGKNAPIAVIDFLIQPEYAQFVHGNYATLFTAMDVRAVEIESKDITVFGSETNLTFDLTKTQCGNVQCGPLKYLPAIVETQDGLSRRYPIEYNVRLGRPDDKELSKPTQFESLAFSVARAGRKLQSTKNEPIYRPVISAPDISYSLPSFALASERERKNWSIKFLNNLHYYTGNELLSDDKSRFDLFVPDNAILIFGSSAAVGGDIHNTPLGPMAGMDVLANSIRSFQISRPPPEPLSFTKRLLGKLKAVIFAVSLSVLFDVVVKLLERRRKSKINKSTVTISSLWSRYSLFIFLTLIVLFIVEFLLVIAAISEQMTHPAGRGGQIDVIWPVIGVLLGTFVSFAGRVTAKIEEMLRLFGEALTKTRER